MRKWMNVLMILILVISSASIILLGTVANPSGTWIEKASTPKQGGYGEAVVGTGDAVYVARCMYASSEPEFWRYDPSTNTWNNMPTDGLPTGAFRNGACLAFTTFTDGGIYALMGGKYDDTNRTLFYRFDIYDGVWQPLANTPHAQGAGDALVYCGYDGNLYAFLGSREHGSVFARYFLDNNTWQILPSIWNKTDDGCSLVWVGITSQYIYALQGEVDETIPNTNFARFNIATKQWEELAPIPEENGVGDGASLIWVSDYRIFALGGGGADESPGYNFYCYYINNNTWQKLEDIPYPVGWYVGNRLAYANNSIYYWQGAPSTWGGGNRFCQYPLALLSPSVVYVDDDFNTSTPGWQYDHFNRIQDAIDAVAEGGTVYVFNGIYYENVVVNKTINLIGEDKNNTIIDIGDNEEGIGIKLTSSAEYCNISGLKLVGGGEYGCWIIVESGNNNIYNNICSGGIIIGGEYITDAVGNKIIENELGWGILIISFESMEQFCKQIIENNTVNGRPIYYYSNTKDVKIPKDAGQVLIANCSDVTVKDINFSHAYCGIELAYSNNITIENNDFYNCGGGILLFSASKNLIKSNIITECMVGIDLINSQNNTILGCDIFDCQSFGIYIYSSKDDVIQYNNIYNNSAYGIYAEYLEFPINATHNYWGSSSGPHHPILNPNGTGGNVSNNVKFTPWLTAPVKGVIEKIITTGESEINAINETDSSIKINTTTNNTVRIIFYGGAPVEEPCVVKSVGKYIEIEVKNESAIQWPIFIQIYYTQKDLDDAGITENQLVGIYFYNETGGEWELYNDTGINTTDFVIDGKQYAGYAWANAWHLTKLTIAADNIKPIIYDYTPSQATTGDVLVFNVSVEDESNVTVYVEYWYEGGEHLNESMGKVGDYWIKEIIIEHTMQPLHYIISAMDAYGNWNNTGEKVIAIVDNDRPSISSIEANPPIQKVEGFVNITCQVIDNIGVAEVYINITYPDGSKHNFSMNKIGDIYYWNATFEIEGEYNFFIYAKDVNGNVNISAVKSFAIFVPQYALTVTVSPSGAGYVTMNPASSDRKYDEGTVVTLTAYANAGYQFSYWSGDASGTAATIQITMDSNKTVVANFVSIAPPAVNHPPNIEITSPSDGSVVSGVVTIQGIAWDADGNETIQKVDIRIDGDSWIVASGITSWSYSWDTTKVANGLHKIEARCYDGRDYSSIVSINVTVNNIVNTPPVVSIDYPSNGSTVSGEIIIKGKAWDEDGNETIVKVEIRIDGGGWQNATGMLNWAYTLDTKKLKNGMHTIEVRAYDGTDYSEISSIQLEVKNKEEKGTPGFEIILLVGAMAVVIMMGKRRRRSL